MSYALSVVVAALAAFVLSSIWYAVATPFESGRLGERAPDRGTRPSPPKVALEIGRNLVIGTVIAGLARWGGLSGPGPALLLGLVLWAGFPLVLLTGSMMWEKTPAVTAALHGADWLIKILAISAIVGAWL